MALKRASRTCLLNILNSYWRAWNLKLEAFCNFFRLYLEFTIVSSHVLELLSNEMRDKINLSGKNVFVLYLKLCFLQTIKYDEMFPNINEETISKFRWGKTNHSQKSVRRIFQVEPLHGDLKIRLITSILCISSFLFHPFVRRNFADASQRPYLSLSLSSPPNFSYSSFPKP